MEARCDALAVGIVVRAEILSVDSAGHKEHRHGVVDRTADVGREPVADCEHPSPAERRHRALRRGIDRRVRLADPDGLAAKFVDVNGVRTRYYDYGEGEAIVLAGAGTVSGGANLWSRSHEVSLGAGAGSLPTNVRRPARAGSGDLRRMHGQA